MSIPSDSFQRLSEILLKQSGIVVKAGKEYLVESRLGPIVQQRGLESIEALVKHLDSPRGKPLVDEVVDAMTTNETSFLRDKYPFEALCDEIVPNLLRSRADSQRIRIWSAACSTGQEIYTIAMLLRERFPELRNWTVELLATDISPSVLEKARSGEYSLVEVNRGLPAPMMVKYFKRRGPRWKINDEIRNSVQFKQANLLESIASVPEMDVVFLRNVLIYFEPETKAGVLERIHERMRTDGVLLLGAAETTMGLTDQFVRAQFAGASGYSPRPKTVPCS